MPADHIDGEYNPALAENLNLIRIKSVKEARRRGNGHAVDAAFIRTLRADQVEQRQVEWMWINRIARGKMTLIGGDPGIGKSQMVCDMIARVTRGAAWPDGGMAPLGNCVILSSEDAPADTICPRLELAGADLSHVHILQSVCEKDGTSRSFSLAKDLALLAERFQQIGDVILLAVDPITAYLGDVDSHRTSDVRGILDPFDKFATERECGVLAITHPPKATQAKAINAFTGSLAFVANARLAFVGVEEQETDRRLLLPVKNNLGPLAEGIGYRIVQGTTGQGIHASHIEWDLAPVTVTAGEAIQDAASTANTRGEALTEAKEFLEGYLEAGPMPTDKVKAAAQANDIHERTLWRAKKKMGIVAKRAGYGEDGEWTWKLP